MTFVFPIDEIILLLIDISCIKPTTPYDFSC